MEQLPKLAGHAFSNECKLLIVNLGTVANGQLIRLRLAAELLRAGKTIKPVVIPGYLDLGNYLFSNLIDKSGKSDTKLLTHLIIQQSIEVTSLTILAGLAVTLHPQGCRQSY